MDFVDVTWHLLNFFAPAAGVGVIASSLTKLLWRRELKPVPWWRLALWAFVGCGVVSTAGLVLLGRDGKMLTYICMILASACGLWWAGWGARRSA